MKKVPSYLAAGEAEGLAATPQARAVLNTVAEPSLVPPSSMSSVAKASVNAVPSTGTLDYVPGAEGRVNTYTAGDQYYPYIAALTGGGYVVVWASAGQDGDGYGIYAQRYNASGVAQGGEVHVSTATADIQAWPTVTGLSDGSYVVIWHSNNQDGGAYGIYMQRYNASGVAQGAETRVNTTTAGEQSFPAVASLTGGGYVVSWQSPDGSSFGIYSQRYNNSGVAQGGEVAVNSTTSGNQRNPGAASLSDGGYVIIWEANGTDGSGYGVYAQRYNASGVAQGTETRVNSYTTGDQFRSVVAGLSGGGYVVVWDSVGQDGDDSGVYMQRYNASGVAQGSESRVNTTTAGLQGASVVSALSDGGFVVTWFGLDSSGSYDIYAQRFNATGVAQGGETVINSTTSGAQVNPIVATLVNGDYVVTWASAGQDGDGQGIYRKHFQANFEPVLSGTPATLAAGNEDTAYTVTLAQLLTGFTDQDGETLTATGLGASNGTVVDNGNGSWTITPTANFNGTMTLSYAVSDGLESKAATLTYSVQAINDAPGGTPTGTVANGVEDTTQTILAGTLLEGLSDVEGQALSISAISADHGTLSASGGGWIFTPDANYNGSVTLTYSVTDGTDVTSGFTRSFNLNATNDAPAGTPTGTVADGSEDAVQVILEALLLQGLTDADGQTLTVSAISVDHGTLAATAGGWIFTPTANYNGNVTLTYTVIDGQGGSLVNQTRSFNLASVNDLPLGTAPALSSATEDVAYTVTRAQLLANISDADGDALSVTSISAIYGAGYQGGTSAYFQQHQGIYVIEQAVTTSDSLVQVCRSYNNGWYYFVRVVDSNGTETAKFNVSASGGITALNDGSFVITFVNNYGTGSNDIASTRYSVDGTILNSERIVANTSAHEQNPYGLATSDGGYILTWTEYGTTNSIKFQKFNADSTANGVVHTVTSGTGDNTQCQKIAQTSDGGYVIAWVELSDIYAQRFDASGVSAGATFRVNTTTNSHQYGANVAALAGGGFVVMWSDLTTSNRAYQVFDASGTAIGAEKHVNGTSVMWANNGSWGAWEQWGNVVALPDGGFAIISNTQSNSIGLFRFDALGNQLGGQTNIVTDPNGGAVLPKLSVHSDGSLIVSWSDDYNNGRIWLREFTNDPGGAATVNYNSGTDTYTITRPADTNGLLTINYEVSDGHGGVKSVSTTLNVNAVNDAPRGSATTVLSAIDEDGSIVVTRAQLLAGYSDPDAGASLSIRNNTVTTNSGTVVYNGANGTWILTPAANYNGTVTLGYTVWDGAANATNAGALTVTVNAVNDAPALTSAKASLTGTEDIAKVITLAQLRQGYSDVDGDTLTVSGISVDHGTISANGDGSYTLTPDSNYYGTITISYTLNDGNGASLATTLGVAFAAVNDAPTGAPTGTVVDGTEDTAQTLLSATLLQGFSDIEGQTLSVSAISVDHGTLTATTGGWVYTPAANYNGPVTVTYTVSDGNGGTVSGQTRSLTLESVNDLPAGSPGGTVANGTEDTSQTILATTLLAGFSDVDGDDLSVSAISVTHGDLSATTGGWIFTPDADYDGAVTVTYTVSDGNGGLRSDQTRSFNLAAINDAPRGAPTGIVADGTEDTTQTILSATLLDGFSDVEGQTLSVSAISVSSGSLTATTGGWIYTPAANYNGPVTVAYTVSDGNGGTMGGQTRSFNLEAIDDVPVANSASFTFNEDTTLTSNVTGSDVETANPSYVLDTNVSHGTLTFNADGTFTYTPNANYNGADSFTYHINDGAQDSGLATVNLTVTSVNDLPTGAPTGVVADGSEDVTQTILAATLLEGFSDIEGDLTVSAIAADQGTLSATDGGWTFTPAANYHGSVTITYTVSDSDGATITNQPRSFNLASDNDTPAGSPTGTVGNGTEDTSQTILASTLLEGFSDIDGDTLSVSAIDVDHGTLTVTAGGWIFAPAPDFNGEVTLTYTVSDGKGGDFANQTRSFNLAAINDEPRGAPTGTVADGAEDTAQTILSATLLEGFSDVEGQTLSVSAISVSSGTLTATTGGWIYTPVANYNGPVTVTYTVSDGNGGILANQTRSFNLDAVNDLPVANDVAFSVDEDGSITRHLSGSDIEGSALSYILYSDVAYGDLRMEADGSFTYTPAADYHGDDSFTFMVHDGTGYSAPATVTLTVTAVNDAPTGAPTGTIADGAEDADQTILASTLLQGFGDVDSTLSISAISVDHGSLAATTGGWVFTPTANYNGPVTLTYTVSDGTESLSGQTRTFNLGAVNDVVTGAPTGTVENGVEDLSQTILASTLLAGFSDIDGDDLSVSAISVDHGTLTATAGGWTFTPADDYNGLVTLTYTVSDSNGSTVADQTREFNLVAVNDIPTGGGTGAVPDTMEDVGQAIMAATLLQGFGDVDGDTLSVSAISVDNGTLTDVDGGWIFQPAVNYSGTVILSYTISDGHGGTIDQTRTFTVIPVNDAPVFSGELDLADVAEGQTAYVAIADLLSVVSDVDSPSLSLSSIAVTDGNGTVIGTATPSGGPISAPVAGYDIALTDPDYNGDVVLVYQVSDGDHDVQATARYTVTPSNDAPTGAPTGTISAGTEDASQTILASTLLQGLSDIDSADITVSAISADHGTLTATSGGWIFTPASDYQGLVTITYTVSDGEGGNLTGLTRSFTVASVNDLPTGTGTGTVSDPLEDTAQTILAATLLEGFSDVDGDTLLVSAISVDHGTLTATTGGWVFEPAANYNGQVVLSYTISDGQGADIRQTRVFTVTPDNDMPAGTPSGTVADGIEDTAQTILAATLLQGLSDAEGDTLSVIAIAADQGTLTATTGGWLFAPNADYNGSVVLTYSVSDGHGGVLVGLQTTFNLVAVPDIIFGTPGVDTVTGTVQADEIRALAGNDLLDGLGGGDTMFGGAGNDTYVLRSGDILSEDLESDGDDGGTDLVRAYVSQSLGDYVENLELAGAGAINGTGNGLANRITGNGNANLIDGGAGTDVLAGGLGNDTFVVDDSGDTVIEADGEGTDLILSSVSYGLTGRYVETLTLTGSAHIDATGNTLANTLNGNSGNNRLDGGLGFDTLTGGLGDDTYVVNVAGDIVIEQPNEGTDTVEAGVTWVLGEQVENLVLTGTANLKGTGNAGNNTLTGNSGNNVLAGLFGDDTYYVQNTGDNVVEADGEGNDLINSSVTYTLTGRYAETLALTGLANIDATGNGVANTLIGNDGTNQLSGLGGHDRLDGGKGADIMIGGTGNDTYVVDNIGDVTTENLNEGIDLVESRITWTIGNNIENLILTGAGDINATGNALNNVLTGNGGHNRLDGGVGIDTMAGGTGDDTYVVHSTSDVVIENLDEGTDTVESGINLSLATNVENLILTGTAAINGTGNALNNVITGNSGNNVLAGGLGDDTYYIQNTGDNVVELGGEGKDLIYSTVTYTLNQRYVETLVLTGAANINATGNTNANTLIGNDGNNILNGKAGPDKLTGGLGADVFFFELDAAKDTITDFSATQNDSINIRAYTNGVVSAGMVSQVGLDTVINLGNGNSITVLNTVTADVLSHIVW